MSQSGSEAGPRPAATTPVIGRYYLSSSFTGTKEQSFPEEKRGKALPKRVPGIHFHLPMSSEISLSSSISDIGAWLEAMDLLEYVPRFTDEQVNGAKLVEMKNEDLDRLGVKNPVALLALLGKINQLKYERDHPVRDWIFKRFWF